MKVRTWCTTGILLMGLVGLASASGSSGLLDASFGTGGIQALSQPNQQYEEIAVDSQNRIVTAGWSSRYDASSGLNISSWVVQRFTATGALDTTFDGDGVFSMEGAMSADKVGALAIGPDDRIFVGGYRTWISGGGKKKRTNGSAAVLCLDVDGTQDWLVDGGVVNVNDLTIVPAGGSYDVIAATQSLVAGDTSDDGSTKGKGKKGGGGSSKSSRAITVLRYDASGNLLSTIVDDVSPLHDDVARTIRQDSQGRLVVGFLQGRVDRDDPNVQRNGWGLTRYLADGSVDADFGTDGRVLGYGPTDVDIWDIAIDSNDAVYACGRLPNAALLAGYEGLLVRYTNDGQTAAELPIPVFAGDGSECHDVEVDSQDRVLLSAWHDHTEWDVTVLRYTTAGVLDTSFGPNDDGRSELFDLGDGDWIGPMAVDGLDRIVMAGSYDDALTGLHEPVLLRWLP